MGWALELSANHTGRAAPKLIPYEWGHRSVTRPTYFEISVEDPDRAERFYSDALGWSIRRMEGQGGYYGQVSTGSGGPGINGGLLKRSGDQRIKLTMDVGDIDEVLERIAANGGKVHGKGAMPGMGWVASCEDTEGNVFGLFSKDPDAGQSG